MPQVSFISIVKVQHTTPAIVTPLKEVCWDVICVRRGAKCRRSHYRAYVKNKEPFLTCTDMHFAPAGVRRLLLTEDRAVDMCMCSCVLLFLSLLILPDIVQTHKKIFFFSQD